MESNVLLKRWVQGSNVVVDDLRGTMFTGENGAHTFQISGVDSAQETVEITGTITGRFLTATNVTVPLTGTVSGGVASLTLTEDCYVIPGRFVLSIYATNGSTTQCIYCAVGNVFRTQSDIIEYPSASIPDIEQIIADAQAAATQINAEVTDAQAAVAAAQTAVDGIEAQRQTMIESIASVAGQGTDTTLSQSGVAADAKAAGDQITDLKSALTLDADYAPVTPTINDTYTGVTCVYESANVIKLYGTSTAARRILCFNGQNALRTSSQAFMQTVGAGEYDVSINITGYLATNALSAQYTYTTFASAVTMVSLAVPTYHASLTQPAMVGLTFSTGANFGTSDNPTYVEFHMTRTVSNDLLPPVDVDSTDETGKTDMAPAIMAMLKQTGHCHLGAGIYYVSGIDMPDGSMLSGCGKKTVVRLLQSVSTGYAVKMTTHNTLSDICISGADAAPVRTSQGTRTGVLYAANHDGTTDGATAYDTERCMIDNVWIENFTDSGLKCHNTASAYRKGLYVTNLMLYACWCGLNIDYISEFNKFVNVQTAFCTYGCRNNGGNNTFTSCTFYGTSVAFYIDGTQPNAAHGALVGCTLCHSGSNTGSAITITGAADGFIISNCQIWYNTINLTNSGGIVFTGCEFGRSADIIIDGGELVMFDGCVWMYDSTYPPVINVSNNNKVKFTGCYGAESGNAITA